jgi:hypothetical protein
MDEAGISALPIKAKRKRLLISKRCKVEPKFVDLQDVTHVAFTGTVSLALGVFPPFALAVSPVDSKDPKLDALPMLRTPRGYMTTKAMIHYMDEIVAQPICPLRVELQRLRLVAHLIMDDYGAH